MTLDTHSLGQKAQSVQLDVLPRFQCDESTSRNAAGTPGNLCLTEPARFPKPDKFSTQMLTHEGRDFTDVRGHRHVRF
jgi:hypothetical protein